MKITEDVRKYAAEQGIAEEEALKKGMEEKSKEFVEEGRGGLREGVTEAFPQANDLRDRRLQRRGEDDFCQRVFAERSKMPSLP